MPTIQNTSRGQVVQIWGKAYIRGTDGVWRPLALGEVVPQGSEILTEQNAIVMMARDEKPLPVIAQAPALPASVDRAIAALDSGDAQDAPAAGLAGGGGGDLQPGLRIDRIVELVTPATIVSGLGTDAVQFGLATRSDPAASPDAPRLIAASSSIAAVEAGGSVNLGLLPPSGAGATGTALTVNVSAVPTIGQVFTAAGAVVVAGSVLDVADLAGLTYIPPADYAAGTPVGPFSYTVSNGIESADGATQIAVTPVNDAPLATGASLAGTEDILIDIGLQASDVDGTVVRFVVGTLPANGTLLLADTLSAVAVGQSLTPAQAATLVFRPGVNWNGSTSFTFSAVDNEGAVSAPATITLTVSAVNDPPVAVADSASTVAQAPVTVAVLGNDSDSDTDPLAVVSASVAAAFGSVVVNGDGTLTFTAAPGVTGPVAIGYTIADPSGATSTATLTVNVAAMPTVSVDVPALTNDSTPTLVGSSNLPAGSTVTLTVTDAGGAVQTFSTTVRPDGSYGVDVPAALAEGPYTAVASVNGPGGSSASANDSGVVDITPPVITIDAPALTSDSTPPLTGSTDLPAGSTIALTVTGANGVSQLFATTAQAGGSFAIDVPAALVNGTFTVVAQATDAAGNSASASDNGVVDTVAPVITVDAPALTSDSTPPLTGSTDLPAGSTVTLTVTGANGAVQTFSGTVQADGSYAVSVPAALVEGNFSVVASGTDAAGNSASASDSGVVDTTAPTLTVDAPALTNDTTPPLTGTTDLPPGATVSLAVTGANGAVQTFSATVQAGGTFSVDVPAALVQGPFSVSATATDAAGNSASASDNGVIDTTPPAASITIDPVTADNIVNAGEATGTITLTGTVGGDVQVGDTVTLNVNGAIFSGLVGAGNTFAIDVPGSAVLADADRRIDGSVTTTDAAGNSTTATAQRPYAVNTAPIAVDDALSVGEDAASGGGDVTPGTAAQDRDADGDTLTVIGVATGVQSSASGNVNAPLAGTWGTLLLDGLGAYTYAPSAAAQALDPGQTVTDTFTYTISDGRGGSATATLSVSVVGADDPTTISGVFVGSVTEDAVASAGGVLAASDADVGTRAFVVQTNSAGTYGTFSIDSAGTWSYALSNAAATVQALAPGQSVTETFVVAADDGTTASITVTVNGTNDAPVVSSTSITAVEEGSPIGLGLAAPSDVDNGSVLAITVTGLPTIGQVQLADGTPVADGATLSAAQLAGLRYLPPADYAGAPVGAFAYTVSDGLATVAGGTTITVNAVNDRPVAIDASASGFEDSATRIAVSPAGSDVDGTVTSYTLTSVPANGALYAADTGGAPLAAGAVVTGPVYFQPNANFNGTVSFNYTATDNSGALSANTATATIVVNPVPDAPTGADATVTIAEDGSRTFGSADFGFTDVDVGDTLAAVRIESLPAVGTLTLGGVAVGAGQVIPASQLATLVYTPVADASGSPYASFTFSVQDNGGLFDAAPNTITLNVTPVNDPPLAVVTPASGDEDTPIAVSLTGTDIDGTVTTVTVTALPANGVLFLADGVTPVAVNTPLSAAAAASLVYRPAPDFNGSVDLTFTVTDNNGAASAPAVLPITVAPVVDPAISIDDVTVNEAAGTVTFTVTLDQATTANVAVNFATGAGSATDGADYTGSSGTLTFAPGVTTQTITLAIADDGTYEGAETFNVVLTGAVNATIADGTGVATIRDDGTGAGGSDDDRPTIAVSSPAVGEGGTVVFSVSLSNPSTSAVTFTPSLSSGSATVGTDTSTALEYFNGTAWVAVPVGGVTIAAGDTSVQVRVATTDDFAAEGDETFDLTATVTAGTTANASASGTATIGDDSDAVSLALSASPAVAEGGAIVYTATLTQAAVMPLNVTLSNGAVIAIAAGATTGSVSVSAPSDDVYVDAGNVSATIAGSVGGNFESLVVNPAAATTAVTDTIDTTTVSITGDAVVAEGATAAYTVSLTSPAQTAVTVNLAYSGTAADGSDFTGIATVTIPAGASSAGLNIATLQDVLGEGSENFTVTITSASGGNFEALAISGTNGSQATQIVDDDTPSLAVSSPTVGEGGFAVFTVSLSNPSTGAVTFNPVLSSGTATVGTDTGAALEYFNGTAWVAVPVGGVTLAAGETSVQIRVATTDDFAAEGSEQFSLTANVTAGLTANASATGTATITDDLDATTVSLSATPSVAEGGSIAYTATLNHAAVTAMTVTLSTGQTITIAAGATSGSVSIAAPGDDPYVDAGSVSRSIASTSGGGLEAVTIDGTAAVTTVTDTIDVITATLTATPSVAEGGSITYTVSLTAPVTGSDVSVLLANGQTVTIPVGSSSGSVSAIAPDNVYGGGASVANAIVSVSGGNFEQLTSDTTPVTTTVTDDGDVTTVTLSATPSVVEGGSIVYTATLTDPAQSPVTVTLSNGAVITIGAGATVGTVSVAAPGDDPYVDASTVSTTIATATGGNFENLQVDASPATTSVTDDVDVTTVALSATPSVAEGGSIVYTATLTNPAGTAVNVTLSTGQVITIAAGATSGSVSIGALGDDPYIDDGSVSRTIASASGGNFESLAVDPAAATTTVTDTIDTTTATLTATPSVAEGGTITYTVSLTAPVTGSEVAVLLANGQTVTIPVGASSGSVNAIAPDDVYGGGASVGNAIVSASGGNFEQLTPDTTPVNTAVTDDGDATTVSLSATPSMVEGGSIVYAATLSSAAQTPVTVTLSNGSVITIAAGDTLGTVSVPAPGDDPYVDASTVSTTISTATGGNFENLQVDATPATTSVTDDVDVTTVSLSATPSVAEGGSIVYTATLTNPAGTAVNVTLSTGEVITIAAGASSGSVSIGAPADDVVVDAGSVSRTIVSVSGGNFESLVVDPAAATTTVTDTIDTTTVSITGDASVAEGATAAYTVSLTSPAQTAVTVNLAYGGTAADGSDFTGVTTVTIPAGASSASLNIATLQDVLGEGSENFTVTIISASGGNFEALAISGTNGSQATQIVDDDTPSIAVSSPTVGEGGFAVFTVSLSNPSTAAVTFNPVLGSGTATVGTDTGTSLEYFNGTAWVAVPVGGVTIAAGDTSVQVRVATTDDFAAEASEDFTLAANVTAGLTANASATGTAAITDDVDATTVALAATPSVAEGGSITYTATLNHAAVTTMTVTLSTGQAITISAGTTSGSVSIGAPSDDPYIDAGSVSRSIASTSGGGLEAVTIDGTAAVTAVTDTIDTTTATLTATPSVAEGGTITYTVSLNAPVTGSDVTVTLTGGQSITIPVGASSGSTTATAADNMYAGGASVSNAIATIDGGNFEQLTPDTTPVTTTVTDDGDVTTVSLSATPSVVEGGSITYTATLSSPAATPVTVTLSTGETITIGAGATSGTVSIGAPGDDPYLDAGTVSRTIATATGGGFENLQILATPATTSVTDDVDVTTVSLSATPSVAEGGSIVYTATLSSAAQTAVAVTLSTGQVITIAAGASSGSVSIAAPADDPYVDAGSVSRTIASASGGNFESLVVDPAAAVTAVTDTVDNTTATLTATPSVAEGGTITYTVSLTAPVTGSDVTVVLANGQTVTIPVGASSGTATGTAPDDVVVGGGSVGNAIATVSGGNFEQLTPDTTPVITVVTDDGDITTVALSATPSAVEGGAIVYTATLSSAAAAPVTVTLSNGAVIGIAAGATVGTVSVPAPGDDPYVDASTVSATISTATGGNFENLQVDATPATTSVTDDVDATTVSLAAMPSVAEGGAIVYTATLTNPAGTAVSVTLSTGEVITIAAGATSGSVSVGAPAEDVYVDAGSVSRTIASASGGNFESLVVNPAAATTAVTDTIDTTTVSITGDAVVAEGATAAYTVSLTSPAQTAVTVNLAYSGTAADGSDFTGIATVTIPAGASSAGLNIATLQDVLGEGSENFTVTITSASGGNFEALAISGTNGSQATQIVDDDTPSLAVSSPTVGEGGFAVFTVSLSNPSTGAVTFNPVLSSGTATVGTDTGAALEYFNGTAWVAVPVGGVTLAAGETSVQIRVATTDDFAAEGSEQFSLTANVTAGLTANASATGTATITDDLDATTVSLSATPSVAEGGSIAYTATLNHAAVTAMTVTLSTGQTITIAAGATSGTVSIAAPGDDPYIDAGSVSRTIATTAGGGFESLSISPAAAVTTVTDTLDVTSATLTATPSVAEGGTVTYTVSLGAPVTGSAVVVTLSGGQTVTIPVGASTGTATATAPDNAYAGGGSVSNAITAVSGGNFEQLTPNTAPVTTTVTDDADVTTLSLSATASVVEGGSITYTATLSNAAQTPVTVTLSTGQTITIAAGATSGTVSIAAPGDDPYIDAGTVSRTIATATGGGFEQLTINPAAAVTNVTDDSDATTVSLTATPSVVEGGTITYTATLSNAAQTAVTVTLSTGQTITIAAGANSGTVSILAPTDDPYLDAGTVSRTITSAAGGNFELLTVDPTAAVTTVTDDSDVTTVSLSATPNVAEGGTMVYTATLTNAAQTPVTVTLSTGQVITIAAGATTGTVSIAAPGDDPYIDAGSVSRTIASASGGNFESLAVNPAAAVTTVTDTIDVTAATLTATPNVTEGGTITYTVSLGAPVTGSPVVVALSGGQTITIPVGASSGTATATAPDNVYAGGGSVSNAIATISGGNFEQLTPNTTPVTTTVSDDADVTTVSLAATPSVVEGGNIIYTATLTNPAQSAVTVTLSTGQTITISAGATTGTVAIAAPGDDPYVDAGTVSRTIATATGGGFESLAIDPAAASTTVTDDSDATTVTLSATPSVAEGGSIVYTATLTNAAQTPVTVTLSTGQTITIAAGATSGTVSIAAPGDDVVVDATTVSRTITTATGGNFEALTINPAAANTSVTDTIDTTTLSITGSTSVAEGASGSYTVSLTSPAQTAVTVTLAYSGTALNGADFTGVATVTIPAGASSANFSIATLDDLIDEVAAESFTVAIGATSGGNFENLVVSGSNGSVTTTIVDNDAAPTVTVSSPTVAEGGGFAQFTVSLSNPSSTATTFSLALANGTATGSGTDYGSGTPTNLQVSTDGGATWANATTATIAANATSVLVRTPIVNDALDETDETFTLTATRTAGTTANASASGTATITDDDATPSLSIGNVSVNESAGTMTFTVTLSAASGLPVSVGYATSNGTATAGVGADYTASSGTLTFAAGVTSQTVTVTIAEDALTEVSETLNVTLSGATNATIATATGVGTIVDNDTPPQGRDATLTTLEDTAIVFGLPNFLMNDAEQGNNVSPSAVRIDTVPSNGNLFLNGVLVTAGQVVSAAAIGAGQLSFVPASNANGTAYASFGFSVRDASGQYDTAPNTITVNVTPVSDGAPDARNDLFQTTFGTPITLTAAQLLANDTLPDGATITAVGGASGGSLVNNGNGTYTWTPSGAGTGSFTYTLTDQDGQTDTATVRIVANAAADDLATVNESALASGTGAGSVTASGNLFANDTGNTSISTVTFNGTTVSDGGAGDVDARTGYIGVASAVGRLVVDSAGAGAGDYTYTLLRNANNSAATDDTSITESFSYNANNTDAALRVTITDDAPAAVSRTVQVSEDQVPSYRLVLVLDVSGSMDTTSAGGAVRQINADGSTTITTRLDLARQALAQLVEEYYNQAQNVSITLITFSGSATIVNPGTPYTSKEDAVNAILTADGSGGTNYSSALTAAQTAFGTVDPSVRNAVYFLSDGAPSGGDLVNPAASTGYATFVNSNGISSYAVGVGTGIATTGPLNGIHNVDADGNGSSDGAIIVPDLNDLGSALLSTVPLAYGGNVVSSSADGNVLGADGGYIQTVTVKLDTDGNAGTAPVDVTFTHNPATNQISSSIAGFPAGFPISGDLLTLGASRGFGLGTLTFNFSTGDYTYFTGGTASEGDSFGFSFVARDGDGDVTPPSTLTVQIADGQPVARPDSDTLLANQTRMEGNVITGLGTDAGLALGGQLTNFAPSGAGVDDAIDGAQISSVSFKGVSYDLGAAASGSGAGFTWSVSAAGQLTWTATSGGEQLVFARTGFYQYAPPATALPTVLTNAAQTTLFNTAANADDNGVVLSAITRTGGTTTLGHNNPGGSADDGVGVTGGDSSGTVDNLETLVVAFSQATHPRGVQGVSFVVSANQSNLGDDGAGTIRSLTYTVYDVAGNELGQFYSTGEGTVAMPAQYSNIGRIEIEANSAADARISSVTFSSINIDTAAAAAAPVEVGYTLTDSDGDSSSSTLTLRVMGNSLFGDSAGNGITGTAGNDRIDGAEGNDTLDGAAGNDLLLGGDGGDAVSGGDGIDELRGGAGNDALNGGNGNDVLVGGMGHDALTGAAGADVFRWELADRGAAGTPALDTVADFSAAQGDQLDLRDLLQGETLDGGAIGNLGNYLFVERTGANTTIHISSNGGFTSGYNAGAEDQTIVLSGVDLTAASTLTSQQVIAELLNNNRLTVDP